MVKKITGATAKLNDVENGNHPEVTLTYTGTGYDGTKVNGTEVPSHAVNILLQQVSMTKTII